MLVRDLYQRGLDSIDNMRVLNSDKLSHQNKSPEKCLLISENENQRYLEACLQQIRHISPFVISADSLLGVEAEATLEHIARCLATKWKQLFSRLYG